MAENTNGKINLPRSLDINTVILIVGIGATFWANQVIFKDRADSQEIQINQLNAHLDATDGRVQMLQTAETRTETKLDDLIISVNRQHAQNDILRSFAGAH